MCVLICIILILEFQGTEGSQETACKLPTWRQEVYSREGDVVIGGVFVVHSGFTHPELTFAEEPPPISCTGFNIRYYRDVLAMVFAIEEINQNNDLLPNITLGFKILDSCLSPDRTLQGVLDLLSGKQGAIPGYSCNPASMPGGIIGATFSTNSVPMARILGLYHFPQISPGSSLSTLSDKLQFPSFLRTIPANTRPNIALVQLLKHLSWTWVAIVTSDDEIGAQRGWDLKKGIEQDGGCVAFMEKVHLNYSPAKISRIVAMIQRYLVKIIIILGPEVHSKMFLELLASKNASDKVLIFTISSMLSTGLLRREAWKIFNGSIGLSSHAIKIPRFEQLLYHLHPSRAPEDIFIKTFWEKAFNCWWQGLNGTESRDSKNQEKRLKPCSENLTLQNMATSLFELNDMSYTYHTYLAVYAFESALHSMMSCKWGQGPFTIGTCGDIHNIQPWQVFHYMKNSNFQMPDGENIYFDENGDAPGAYDICNVQMHHPEELRVVKVGHFDPRQGNIIHINLSAILWSGNSQVPRSVCSESCPRGYRKAAREAEPVCCFDCLPCSHGEIADNESITCLPCPEDQWTNQKREQCTPKLIDVLSFGDVLGSTLAIAAAILTLLTASVLCIFTKYRQTAIVKANNRGLSYLLLSALMLCFLCSFIFISYPRNITCMLRQTVFGVVFSISVSSVLAKTILVVLAFKATNPSSSARKWLGSKTPWAVVLCSSCVQVLICVIWLLNSPPFPELNMKSYNDKIIFQCNEGETVFFYCMLGYMGLLATISFMVAFLSRNLPGSFNEAKLITFSMLVFVSVWISFIPAYLSTRGKYMVAVEVFAILCSGAGLVGFLFFPKCYIIVLKSHKNTRHYLAGNRK